MTIYGFGATKAKIRVKILSNVTRGMAVKRSEIINTNQYFARWRTKVEWMDKP